MRLFVLNESKLIRSFERQTSVLTRTIVAQVLTRRHILVVIGPHFLLLNIHYLLKGSNSRQLGEAAIGSLVGHQERLDHLVIIDQIRLLLSLKVPIGRLLPILEILPLHIIKE